VQEENDRKMKPKLKIAREFAKSLKYPEVRGVILFGSVAKGK